MEKIEIKYFLYHALRAGDWFLLHSIKNKLGVGKVIPVIWKHRRWGAEYIVNDKESIEKVIIPYFSNNLRTERSARVEPNYKKI